jgi:glycosyltransferase involved in cell wall biosynthesis
MEKIKIVHISETFVSGVYTYIKQINRYSESNGSFKNHIIYSGERIETNESSFKQDFSPETKLIRIDMTREISLFRDFKSLVLIIREIRRIKPDIIHVHSSKAGVLGRVARVFYPKATLYYTPNGYSFIREDISESKKALYKFVEKTITKIFGGIIIACGDHEYAEAKKLGKAILVRNGVDIDLVSAYHKEHHNPKLTIGTSGRIYYQKNPSLFNEIALKLPDYNFIWIGDGDLKDKLFAKNITITGWSTYEQTLKAVNELDIFISTSSWEGLPFSIIEAMTLSKPIVSSNIEGNRVTVNQNENGYICDTLDGFLTAIKKLESSELRNQFGNESFKIANSIFNMDKNVVELLELYKK